MNKFMLIILFCGMNLFAQRLISLNFIDSLRIPYHRVFIMVRENHEKYEMIVETSSASGTSKKWNETNKKYRKELSKELFEDIYKELLKLNVQEIINNNDHVPVRYGTSCILFFGNPGNYLLLQIWSPDANTENRKLSEYLKLVTKFIELSGLNSAEIITEKLYKGTGGSFLSTPPRDPVE